MNQPGPNDSSLRPSRRTPKVALPRLPIQRGGAPQKKQRQKGKPQHPRTTGTEARLAAMGNDFAGLDGALNGALLNLNKASGLLNVAVQCRLEAEAGEITVEDGSIQIPNGGLSVPDVDNATTAVPLTQDASAEADREQSLPPSPKSSITLNHNDHTPQVSPGAREKSPHQSSAPVETTEPPQAVERMSRKNESPGKYHTSPSLDAAHNSSSPACGTFEERGEDMTQMPVPLAEQQGNKVQSVSIVSVSEEPLTEAQDGATREIAVVDEKAEIVGKSRQAKKKLRLAEKKMRQEEEEKARQAERKIHQSERNRKKKERRKERKSKDSKERNAEREEEGLEPTPTADAHPDPTEKDAELPRLAALGLLQISHTDTLQKHQAGIQSEVDLFKSVTICFTPDFQSLIDTASNDKDLEFFRGCLKEMISHTETVDAEVEAIQVAGGDFSEVRTLLREKSKSIRETTDKVKAYQHDKFQIEVDRLRQYADYFISNIEDLTKLSDDTQAQFHRGIIEEIKRLVKSIESEVEAIHAAGGNINDVRTVVVEKGESMTAATNKVYTYEEDQIKDSVDLFKRIANEFATETESYIGPSTNDIDSEFYRGIVDETLELTRTVGLDITAVQRTSGDPQAARKVMGVKWASIKALMERLRKYDPTSDYESDMSTPTHSACPCDEHSGHSDDQDQPSDESEGRTMIEEPDDQSEDRIMNELERYLLKEASQEENGLRTDNQENGLRTEDPEVSPILAYLARLTAWEANIIVPMQNNMSKSEKFNDESLTPQQIKVRLHLRCFQKMRTAPLTPLLPMPKEAVDLVQKYINPRWYLAIPLNMRHHDILGEAGAWYEIVFSNELYWLEVLEGKVTVDWVEAEDHSRRWSLPNRGKGFYQSFMPKEIIKIRVFFEEDSVVQGGQVPADQEALTHALEV